ncbi:uncharacterized protein CTHT_0035830 [Thermochaetoides thermophila DSM 1495]|uniref:Signal peptidase complex catalytic subunit SEC11 n=1 Tax=Chaetomium thermophilum (strain DSM 1495 / CBS 144.50 / IMI 039719) TaxID=759272 RepID=G0S718_CHATD|nr:hypothetical protein CTHT_0035830 [Thermochaetoides thermophila DSM 1495]EGS21716.1 hypothetical protein CTHT_0035830 [Thermochaetoides thermophila DSM 1495]
MLSTIGNPRQAATQLLNFALILSTAFMMWKGLSVITDSPSPIVVVLSGSMEPAFQRGDLLFLWNRNIFSETNVGEIVVYNVKGKDIPIVHRVVRKFGTGPDAKLLTKGDNNAADDTELYARGQDYLTRKDIVGSVVGYVPFVGYVTIMLSEHPWLKTVMLGLMGLGESTWNPTELILGLSGTPALLAMLMTLIDYSVMWRSKLRKAANPGVGIAIHLLTWFIDSFAIWIVSSYTDTWCDEEGCIYHYPIKNTHKLGARSILYLKVLLAFDCLLGAISFILFVGCCVETHLVNKAKDRHRKTPLLVYVPCSDSGFVQGPNFWQVKSAVDNGPIRLQPALIYGWGIMKEASNSAQQKGSQQAIPGVLYGYPEPVAPPALKGNNAL